MFSTPMLLRGSLPRCASLLEHRVRKLAHLFSEPCRVAVEQDGAAVGTVVARSPLQPFTRA
jgi:hypothetical protein